MDPKIVVAAHTYVICVAASPIFAIMSVILGRKARRQLNLAKVKRARNYAKIATLILILALAVALFVPAVLLALPATRLVMLVVPIWICLHALAWTSAPRPTVGMPDGPDSGYEEMEQQFPLTKITTNEEYKRASSFHQAQLDRNALARDCGNAEMRLTRPQWRYLRRLEDLIRAYERRFPRLMFGQEWYYARCAQIKELETITDIAMEKLNSREGRYEGARLRLEEAGGLETTKALLEGPHDLENPGAYEWLHRMLDCIETSVDKRIASVREALRLMEAEDGGYIKYKTPARVLIYQAGCCNGDHLKSEALLKQAIAQGREPDADTTTLDLAIALHGLGFLYYHRLKRPAEAVQLYLEAVKHLQEILVDRGEEDPNFFLPCLDLAEALVEVNKLDDAKHRLLALLEKHDKKLPANLTGVSCARALLATIHVRQRDFALAEAALAKNLSLCFVHDFVRGVETDKALDELIRFYAQQERYEEAAGLIDRSLIFNEMNGKSAADLREYDRIFKAAGRELEAKAYGFESLAKRIDARRRAAIVEGLPERNGLEDLHGA